MAQFRLGAPLAGRVSKNGHWNTFPIFDMRNLVFSLAAGAAVGGGIAIAWCLLNPASLPLGSPSIGEITILPVFLIIIHELLHVVGFPSSVLSKNTVIGIWPQFASPFVQYLAPMPRNRYLLALMLPFFFISIFPMLLAQMADVPIVPLSWMSVLNCVGAGSDIFISLRIVMTVPSNALVLECGELLYWSSDKPVSPLSVGTA